MYEAIILAGGFGTRLREAVPDLPKPMAPIANKPFLAWQISYLISLGVTRFILSVGYKANTIRNYFGDVYQGAEIIYAEEPEPLGTGGAIQYALKHAVQERVFVLNGDTFCNVDLNAFRTLNAKKSDSVGILVKYVNDAGRYGTIRFDEQSKLVTNFGEKASATPGFINAGIYDIPKNIDFKSELAIPFSFEMKVLPGLVNENLFASVSGDFFIDIGIPEDYERAQLDIPHLFESQYLN